LKLPPKTVILSFDDGPNKAHSTTERLLSVLKKHHITAHFSLIGKNIESNPDITRSIAMEGHSIVNHGYEHLCSFSTTNLKIKKDIEDWENALNSVLGSRSIGKHFYRPPYGIYRFSMNKIIREHNLRLLPISFYTMDAECGPTHINTVVKRSIEGITYMNGGIIVLHDGKNIHSNLLCNNDPDSKYNRSWIPDAVEIIIKNLKGYQFALLNDFL
jgi:peptidoglycan/xylan/chitin deacetylase (PgdA/CDA1 family)